MVFDFSKGMKPERNSTRCVLPPSKENEQEVDCELCGLDPMCQLLEYGEDETDLPEGILLRRQRVAKGETIFRVGDPFRSIFAVKSGSFMTLNNTPRGVDQVVGFSFTGELIGTDGLAGGYYTSTARALEASSVCELRLERLQQAGRPIELLQQGIIALLGEDIAFCRSLNASLIRQNGEQRLAAFILSASNRMAARGMPSEEFKLNMSRTDIAGYLGLSRESVSRGLAKLQKEGICEVRGKQIQLQDKDRLRRLADNI